MEGLGAEQHGGLDPEVVDRSPSNDAVVVVRIALHLGQALAAAGGAALVVGLGHGAAVVLVGHRLADRGHQVDRAIAEVRHRDRVHVSGAVEQEVPVGGIG